MMLDWLIQSSGSFGIERSWRLIVADKRFERRTALRIDKPQYVVLYITGCEWGGRENT